MLSNNALILCFDISCSIFLLWQESIPNITSNNIMTIYTMSLYLDKKFKIVDNVFILSLFIKINSLKYKNFKLFIYFNCFFLFSPRNQVTCLILERVVSLFY